MINTTIYDIKQLSEHVGVHPHVTGLFTDTNGIKCIMSCSSSLPYFCPRCGDVCRFSSVPELRAHLVSQHTYETLLVLSQVRARSSNPGSLVPLPSPTSPHKPCSPSQQLPSQLDCLDLASSYSVSSQLLREVFQSSVVPGGHPVTPCTALALPGTPMDAFLGDLPGQAGVPLGLGQSLGLEFGFWPTEGLSLGVGLDERLGLSLDPRICRTLAEVEERVSRRVSHLVAELDKREVELQQHSHHSERLGREKQEVEDRASYLSRQVTIATEMMEGMRKHLEGKDRELSQRHQEMVDIECFLRQTAEKEADAKDKLQVFIETLLERADHAERQLFLLTSHAHKHNYRRDDRHTHTPSEVYTPPLHRAGHSLDGSTDDIIGPKPQSIMGNRRSYSVSGEYLYSHHYNNRRPCRHHSTEEEEEDEDDEDSWNTHETGVCSPLHATPSRLHHGDRALGADTLRLRAGLFCVFPYLDVASLLLAAEVCYDWRFVARHPAVWTRLQLESARVSTKFLCTLSQWCTQTHTVILRHLRPRHKRADESRQDYHRNTRGMLESGVEALLRSTGGSLVQLSVSRCPHILTDRCLWLASCYCRNLQTLTYRSSSDPLGHEVVWALGAGCRNITHLQVAPNHPCQQSTRFSNRCLQTIGRCWPNLLSLSVGGAGCGAQGLAAVVRSCINLQVLELERITDLGLQVAAELCKDGLKNLQTLILTHTPVSGQAILHFHSACVHLRSIVVEVSAGDYFEETDSQETRTLFEDIINTLQVLQRRPGLCDVLKIKTEAFC